MKKLVEKQCQFSKAVADLIKKAEELGYGITLGDAFRDERCMYGSKSSKHRVRLAIDINLFQNGKYLPCTKDHRELGEWWESIGGVWGGRFDDGNHYEWPMRG